MKKIIAFSGSNSSESINQQLIKIVAGMVKKNEVEILSIRDFPAVVYGIDEEKDNGFPKSMLAFNEKMKEADGFLISSPEHNGSMPAAFKNTLDWVSRMGGKIFKEKPTLFLSTSPGARGGSSVLEHLLAIMPHRGAQIVGGYSVSNYYDKVADGKLINEEDKAQIESLVAALEGSL